MVRIKSLIVFSIRLFLLIFVLGIIGGLILWLAIVPSLPSVEALREVRLQVPLRIYSADEKLLLEVGEQRRIPLALDAIPERLRQAFLAAEDDRFYRHPGIDWRGTTRAVWLYARSLGRGRVPGGSTITQQVARRFFLSSEYSVTRKLREMLLALKIEREMSKDEIFELYLNKEFLGHRAYGVGAAAQVYYGKSVDELTLAEMAMIASLPKAPSRDNPISGPDRAMIRRNWVLDRMKLLDYISDAEHAEARGQANRARFHGPVQELQAAWIGELARQAVVDRLGASEAYSGGYRAFTTIESNLQRAADQAVRNGLHAYDQRHGWRGAEQHWTLPDAESLAPIRERLAQIRPVADLDAAVVLDTSKDRADLMTATGERLELTLESVQWARPHLGPDALGAAPKTIEDVLGIGDVVRLRRQDDRWELGQIPRPEAALVSLDAQTGAILAMVGGLDFGRSQFNRVTQSRRQPGSSFKPFIYAAAFNQGFHPASIVNDAPVVVDDPSMERLWRPTNFSRRFHGPTRLREAMIHSRNLISVRLLLAMGLDQTRDFVTRFGFEPDELPNGPSLALGSASLTPLSIARAYATFTNGGHLITPGFLYRVETTDGRIVHEPEWPVICDCPERPSTATDELDTGPRRLRLDNESPEPGFDLIGPVLPPRAKQAISPQIAWLIRSMMADVVRLGTGRRALALERSDLAGKTGTTNDLRDTWFSGFGGGIVTTVWLGMDDNESLGSQEQGGRTALPLWIDFMAVALQARPEFLPSAPVNLVQAYIDPDSGLRVGPEFDSAIVEWFQAGQLPAMRDNSEASEVIDPYDID